MVKLKFCFLFFLSLFVLSDIKAQLPSDHSDLLLWLRADSLITKDIDNYVDAWGDLSGNNQDASSPGAPNRPIWVDSIPELNNKPALRFDGSTDWMEFGEISGIRTVFIVFKHATGSQTNFPPILGHPIVSDFHGSSVADQLFRTPSTSVNIRNGVNRLNSIITPALEIPKPVQYSVLSISTLGNVTAQYITNDKNCCGGRYWHGDYVEIILFGSVLSEDEVAEIENYLFERYAPSVELGEDIMQENFCDTLIKISKPYFTDYLWSDGSIADSLIVSGPGKYWVQTTDIFGRTSSDTISISYPGNLIDNFTLCALEDSLWNTFLDESEFSITWSDNTEGSSLLIEQAGSYSFTATDLSGCIYSSPTIVVSDDAFPLIDAIPDLTSLCSGELLSPDFGEPIQSIEWNTGEEITAIEINSSGTYSFSALNLNGCILDDGTEVTIEGVSPIANFSASALCDNFEVQLMDESIPQDASDIVLWSWSVDDVILSSEQSPIIPFGEGGLFQVKLVVETENGCKGQILDEVTVPGPFSYAIDVSNSCAGTETSLMDQSSIANALISSKSWEIFNLQNNLLGSFEGDEGTLSFPQEGDFPFRITFTTDNECEYIYEDFINIDPPISCFIPSEIDPLTFWLAADSLVTTDENERVSVWGNIIDSEHDAIALAPENEPLFVESISGMNNMGAIRFSGVNWMNFGEVGDIREVFILFKHETGTQNNFPPVLGHPTLQDFHGESGTLLFRQSSISQNLIEGETRLNGQIENIIELEKPIEYSILGLSPSDDVAAQYITNDKNCCGGRYWNGDYLEILFFDEPLNPEEISDVEQYLRYKYAPPIDLPRQVRVEYGFCDTALVGYQPWFRTYDWSTGSQDSTIQVNASGWYSLTATDLFGYSSTDSVEVIFDGSFKTQDETLCELETLTYATELDTEDYSIQWSTSETTPSIDITEEGFYSVTVTDTLGCSYSTPEIFIDVDSFPITANLIDIPTFCLGNDLFLSSGFEEAETYLWSTDETSPFIQPQESGEYWVEAINGNGCTGRDTVEIDIVGVAPEAAFAFSPPCANNDVVFNDETAPVDGVVSEWSWTFENTQTETSEDESPAIFYPTVGAYPVALTVTLDNGCTGTTRDTITVNPLPLVNFSAPIVCAGNEVFFESFSSVPGNGTIAQRDWSFGNGTNDIGSIGSTTFEELGSNTVTHIVTTQNACVDSLLRVVDVLGSPIVDFDVQDVCIDETVVFNENVDTSESGPVFFNWQFGDGFFSNFPNTTHGYAQPGVYEVTLTAIGNNVGLNGCVDQETKEIRVYEPLVPEIVTTDACIGATTVWTDLSNWETLAGIEDPVIARSWIITDGPTGTQEGVIGSDSTQIFVPGAAGTFDVSLVLESASGCTSTATGSFLVQAMPTAEFNLELPTVNPPFTSSPTNLSEDGEAFEWLINGEIVSTEFDPTLSFESAGEYAVWLVATNDLNCNDTAMAMYTVIVPEYDIALIDLEYQTTGGKLVLNALIGNNGNVPVEVFDTDIQVGRDIDFNLESVVTIDPGDIVDYPLGSEIGYLPGRDLPYTCMRIANPNGQVETDTTNNYLCIGLNAQRATFAAPYPNPAKDEVKLTFVLPQDGPLNVEITAADGREIEKFVLELKEGLNTVDYPLTGWSEGMYLLKFSYRNQEEVHRLVVAR